MLDINKSLVGINNSLDTAEVRISKCKNGAAQNCMVTYIRSVLWDYNYEILKSFLYFTNKLQDSQGFYLTSFNKSWEDNSYTVAPPVVIHQKEFPLFLS